MPERSTKNGSMVHRATPGQARSPPPVMLLNLRRADGRGRFSVTMFCVGPTAVVSWSSHDITVGEAPSSSAAVPSTAHAVAATHAQRSCWRRATRAPPHHFVMPTVVTSAVEDEAESEKASSGHGGEGENM
uniref:Uncharacterized protein n=1 Tax=Oryza brachyantha TaxID=4533 RepID=J3L030_ORYBR